MADAHGEEPCPDCGTPSPRLISHTSFVLKGGGWYVTDYGYRKGVNEGEAPKKDQATNSTKSETTTKAKDSTTPDKAKTKSPSEVKSKTTTAQAS